MARHNNRTAAPATNSGSGIGAAAAEKVTPPNREIVPGCLVYLRSGSPRMTVLAVKDGIADVVLNLYGTLEMRRDSFPVIALDFVSGPKNPTE